MVGTKLGPGGGRRYIEKAPKRFPAGCHIANLAPYVGKAQRLLTPDPVTVERDLGRIPYEEFSDETNAKSGLRQDEPIVYVEVKAGTEAPTGWRSQGFFFTRAGQGPTH